MTSAASAEMTSAAGTLAAFDVAYAEAIKATSELRAAYSALAYAERALASADAENRAAATKAIVAGRQPAEIGAVSETRAALGAARERVAELKAEDAARQAALAAAVRTLTEAGGKPALGAAIEGLIAAGEERLELAVDEVAAARRQLATTLGLLSWLTSDGAGRAVVPEAATMTRVEGLMGPSGDAYAWRDVEHALRRLAASARLSLAAFLGRPAPRAQRVPWSEVVQWNLANGGSHQDSLGAIRDRYLAEGPRSADFAKDVGDAKPRSSDQRTWR